MELTGVAEAARGEEMRTPECLWEKWLTEATSGLNDWLGTTLPPKNARGVIVDLSEQIADCAS
jgi:hypothetical protein